MKANKYVQAKGSTKSMKWKGTKGCRLNVKSSDETADLVAQAYQTDVRKKRKCKVKRLQKEPRHVSGSTTNSDAQSGLQKSYAHTNGNGSSTVTMEKEAEDSQDWNAYAQYVLGNEAHASDSMQDFGPGRLERESFIHCAERNDHQNHAVLVMQKSQTLCFRGKCLLTCLYGRVEVMGFTIEEGQQSYPLFSPASHCPLTITALGASEDLRDEGMGAAEILHKYLTTAQQNKLVKRISRKSSVILLEPMETALTRFLSSFTELSELFIPPVTELMSAVLDTPLNGLGVVPLVDTVPGLIASQSFKDALNTVVSACRGDLDGCAVILVCGSKNVGKSTFNRILINTLLNHTTCIDYMECDLGQTEFTPSGCLSMSTVREPLLGPPFSHQRAPEHMIYYGQTSCETDMDRYMEILKSLWHRRPQRRETTIVINTMGWVKGFGLKLLVDMIRFFPVSHVVQLDHSGSSKCPVLTPEFLRTAHGWQTHPPAQAALDEFTESHSPPKSYVHISVQSEFKGVTNQGTWKHQRSNEQRELSLLAYLSQLQSPDPSPIRPLHCLIPYQVPHSAVAVGVTHCEVAPNHMLYAANASLVGLCCLGEKVTSKGGPALLSQTPVCPCVGLGVLRGIDMKRGLYYLLTPVDPTVLREVNCLLLGAVSLPACILKTQPGFEGDSPYVTTDYSFDVTGAGKLRIFKGLARSSQMATK